MKSTSDPSSHQARERQMIEHVTRLLDDPRLSIDTVFGRRAVAGMAKSIEPNDGALDLKRVMSEMGLPDRELEKSMPVGQTLDVTLTATKWMILTRKVGNLKVICVSPTRHLLRGETPPPMGEDEVRKLLRDVPPPLGGVPQTILVVATAGFVPGARVLADRGAERTVILAEPNDGGGWTIESPPQIKALAELLDPEIEDAKRDRIKAAITAAQSDLLSSGIAAEKLAVQTALPLQMVENELKTYAKNASGLACKRLDGRVVLYREGSSPVLSAGGAPAAASIGNGIMSGLATSVTMIDKVKALFSRKGEHEKKIAFLSERRAALSMQRDRIYDDLSTLEKQEADLKQEFKDAGGDLTRRRITGQMIQLRKDIERRQQLVTVLNQQVNVVSTHLHNLELVQQGNHAKLPDSEEIASDAAAAEEVLASLQADAELAESVGSIALAGMSDEEREVYEQLAKETGLDTTDKNPATPAKARNSPQSATSASPPERMESSEPAEAPKKRDAELS